MKYYVYHLHNRYTDDSYVGATTDLVRRMTQRFRYKKEQEAFDGEALFDLEHRRSAERRGTVRCRPRSTE